MKIGENDGKQVAVANIMRCLQHPVIQQHSARMGIIQTCQNFQQRRFAAAVTADNEQHFTGMNVEIDRAQRKNLIPIRIHIRKSDIFQLNGIETGLRPRAIHRVGGVGVNGRIQVFFQCFDIDNGHIRPCDQGQCFHDVPQRPDHEQDHGGNVDDDPISQIRDLWEQKYDGGEQDVKKSLSEDVIVDKAEFSPDIDIPCFRGNLLNTAFIQIPAFCRIHLDLFESIEEMIDTVEKFIFFFQALGQIFSRGGLIEEIYGHPPANDNDREKKSRKRQMSDI